MRHSKCHDCRHNSIVAQEEKKEKEKMRERKITPLGVIVRASTPRGSPINEGDLSHDALCGFSPRPFSIAQEAVAVMLSYAIVFVLELAVYSVLVIPAIALTVIASREAAAVTVTTTADTVAVSFLPLLECTELKCTRSLIDNNFSALHEVSVAYRCWASLTLRSSCYDPEPPPLLTPQPSPQPPQPWPPTKGRSARMTPA